MDEQELYMALLTVYENNFRGLHWKLSGHNFNNNHTRFSEYYEQLGTYLDETAEQMIIQGKTPVSSSRALDILNQIFLLLCDLFRRPGQRSISLPLALTFPAQSLIAQGCPTAGASVFQTHDFTLLQKIEKRPASPCHIDGWGRRTRKDARNYHILLRM